MSWDTMSSPKSNSRTPLYANATLWILAMVMFLGGTFAIDLNHDYGPLTALALGGGGLACFALSFWSLGRNGRSSGQSQASVISDAYPDDLLITDQNGNFLSANAAFYTLLSFAVEERRSHEISSLNALVDSAFEDSEDLKRLVARAFDGTSGDVDISVRNVDGIHWRRISARCVTDRDGEERIFWRIADITKLYETGISRQKEDARLIDYIDCGQYLLN